MFGIELVQKEASPVPTETEEVIVFCVDFIDDLKPIGVPKSRYEGRLNGKGTLGKKKICLHR